MARQESSDFRVEGAYFVDADLSEADFKETDIAEGMPTGLSPTEEIRAALRRSDELTRGEGADAAAVCAENRPEEATPLVLPLHNALVMTALPSIRATAVRALATIAAETGTPIAASDKTFADLLRDGDELVRETVAMDLAAVVVERPDAYPETVSALREALDDESRTVRVGAAKALAVIAHDRPDVLADLDVLLADLERLRDRTDQPENEVEPTIGVVQTVQDEGGTTVE